MTDPQGYRPSLIFATAIVLIGAAIILPTGAEPPAWLRWQKRIAELQPGYETRKLLDQSRWSLGGSAPQRREQASRLKSHTAG